MKHLLVAGTCLVVLTGCASSAPDTATDLAAINAVREREIAAFTRGQADSLAALVTADAVFYPPNEAQLDGSAAVRAWAANIASQMTVEGSYTSSSVTVAGDWAIDRYTGTLTVTPRSGGAPMRESFRGVHVLRREADGSWKIAVDIWNSEAPPPSADSARARTR